MSGQFEFILQNDETTPKTYTTAFKGVNCTINEASFTVNGKALHSSMISARACPTEVSTEGSIQITTEQCSGELPIKLYNGVLARVVFDQEFLIKALIGFFTVFIILAGIVLATR